MSTILQLNSVGLTYDCFGVAILGYAFFSRSVQSLEEESGTYWGANEPLLRALVQSRSDVISGTILLIIGFVLQWLGSIGIENSVVAGVLYIILGLVLGAYWGGVRGKLITRQLKRAKELRDKKAPEE